MAVASQRATVGTSSAVLAQNTAGDNLSDARTRYFLLQAQATSGIVHVGGSNVSTSNSFRWDLSKGPLRLPLEGGEKLYALVASGSVDVDVLSSGR